MDIYGGCCTKWAFERCPAKRYGLVLWSHGSGQWNTQDRKNVVAQAGGAEHVGDMPKPDRGAVGVAEEGGTWSQEELAKIAQQVRGSGADLASNERGPAQSSMALFRTTLREIMAEPNPNERAILFDNGTQHSLDTLQLASVAAEIQTFIGQPLDLLGMDACLMASIEVAYELRQHVRHMVASEELVPGTSWPYDTILADLMAQPDMSSADLAQCIAQNFLAYYTANPPPPNGGDVTKVALDLARIGDVSTTVKALADALRANMPGEWKNLWKAQYDAFDKETDKQRRVPAKTKFGYHLWDMRSLAAGLVANNAVQADVKAAALAVVAALQPGAAVIANAYRGDWFDGIGGVSVYMPPSDKPMSTVYDKLAFAKDTGWAEMLKAYRSQW